MKLTAKLKAAVEAAERVNLAGRYSMATAEQMYEALIGLGMAWDAKAGTWAASKRPIRADGVESKSIFSDDNNQPSGVYRLRVMAHPAELAGIVADLRKKLTVIEISEKEYPNRRGEGVRIYLTCKR